MPGLARKLVAVLAMAGATLIPATVAAPAAQADCLMIGKSDLGAGSAWLHNYALQMNCDGQLRIRGYLQDMASDSRSAKLRIRGYRSDGTKAWQKDLTASGYGQSVYFDWYQAKVYRIFIEVWAENAWGTSDFHERWHYNI